MMRVDVVFFPLLLWSQLPLMQYDPLYYLPSMDMLFFFASGSSHTYPTKAQYLLVSYAVHMAMSYIMGTKATGVLLLHAVLHYTCGTRHRTHMALGAIAYCMCNSFNTEMQATCVALGTVPNDLVPIAAIVRCWAAFHAGKFLQSVRFPPEVHYACMAFCVLYVGLSHYMLWYATCPYEDVVSEGVMSSVACAVAVVYASSAPAYHRPVSYPLPISLMYALLEPVLRRHRDALLSRLLILIQAAFAWRSAVSYKVLCVLGPLCIAPGLVDLWMLQFVERPAG